MTTSGDPNVIYIPEAARVAGVSIKTFRLWLEDEDFAAAILCDVPRRKDPGRRSGSFTHISKPKLLRRLHGDEASVAS